MRWHLSVALSVAFAAQAQDDPAQICAKPGLFHQLTEPPCSYCSTQDRKRLIKPDDRVIAWVRGAHNGGAIPIRHFLAVPRVINDTYGLFFYDPDGGYVSAFKKDYGFEFHGWKNGVMVVKGRDGTLWSALGGVAIEGPQKGARMERIPSMLCEWGHWLMLHPESTAYDLYDGKKYALAELPQEQSDGSKTTMGKIDARLPPMANVLGVQVGGVTMAFVLDGLAERACLNDKIGEWSVAAFWYAPTKSAVAYRAVLDEKKLELFADEVSPETAPFKDKDTGSRWTLAGRAVDGLLKHKELTWVDSVQCRWFAWVAEHPGTLVHVPPAKK